MKVKNKITTAGYFLRRLRESGFLAIRLFSKYATHDPRKWTIMVDPGNTSVLITCYKNKEYKGDVGFEINDGGVFFPKNYMLKTQSMEIIITNLLEKNIPQKDESSIFVKNT